MNISCKDRFFVDGDGRARLYCGVNIVDKSVTVDGDGHHRYNFNPTDENLKALADRGMNVIRLGITWAGVQPEPDTIDYTYLDDVKAAIRRCNSFGFTVYVDFHQDLFSKFICTAGDGAPRFACNMRAKAKAKDPVVIWAEDYFLNPRVMGSFDNFWAANSWTQKQFMFMLEKTAEYLADCDIMAYDVLNEPYPGTPALAVAAKMVDSAIHIISKSKRVDRKKLIRDLKSGDMMKVLEVIDDEKVFGGIVCAATDVMENFYVKKYTPFLARCDEALRKGGYQGIIFAEHSYFSNLGIPAAIGKVSDKMAFAPHGYDVTVDTPLTNTASPYRIDFIFNEAKRTQDRLNVPVLVGEWGGMVDGADDYPALRHLVKKFDGNYWSHTYWHWFNGIENTKIMDTMTRTYPVAVAGTPEFFENTPGRFALNYKGDASCTAPTEIFLAKKPKKVFATAPYKIEGNRLYADAVDGGSVIIIEF